MKNAKDLEIVLWRDAMKLLAAPHSLKAGLRAISRIISRHFEVDLCAIYLLDRRTEELVLKGMAGEEGAVQERLRVGQGIAGLAAYQRKSVQVAHLQRDPRSILPQGREHTYQSIVVIPVDDGEQLLGVVELQSKKVRQFAADEMGVLEQAMPRIVLGIIRTAQILEDMKRRTDELQALNELGQAMNAGLGLDETLELIAARAAEALSAKGSAVRLLVEDGTLALGTMVTESEVPFDSSYEKRIAEYVAATGEPIMIDDVRASKDPKGFSASMVCVPLVLEDRVVGTLTLFDKIAPLGTQRRLFSVDDLNMLFALSSQIAAEIEDIRLTARLQELVRTEKQQGEELRGFYNRSRALLQSISDGLLAIDQDGTVEEVNAVAVQIFGFGEQRFSEHPHIDELVEDKPPLREWLKSGEPFSNRVITLETAAGKVAAMANLQPIMDAGKRAIGAVLTFREMGEVGRLVTRVIGVQRTFSFDDIIGESSVIEKTKELARIAAGTSSNILIQGETGTGKEVFAQAIHNVSSFSEGPFLAVNCAAIPRDLIESELFGYVEGAFTGASKKGRLGKFELASGGTIFLDEIGDIPLEVQVKLLRVLQEKAIVRVGGNRTIPINCRLIAATNHDLHQQVDEQKFRRDLLYRLNVITIEIPPLRERVEDIPRFIDRFVQTFSERNVKVVDGVKAEVMAQLVEYEWPGNVRELENAIEHAVALVKGRLIEWDDLPAHLQTSLAGDQRIYEEGKNALEIARRDYEMAMRQLYLEALRADRGNVPSAAQLLGMSKATLYRRLKRCGLQAEVSKLRYESQN